MNVFSIIAFMCKVVAGHVKALLGQVGGHRQDKAVAKGKAEGRRTAYSPQEIEDYLNGHYDFRYNTLTGKNEYRRKGEGEFTLVDDRHMNALCIDVQKQGMVCWDSDMKRLVNSTFVPEYQPIEAYVSSLPEWDGRDRATDLLSRVSGDGRWLRMGRKWLRAVVAQWMGVDHGHGNSLCPILVSVEQGMNKSSFCRALVPKALSAYYTEQLDLSASSRADEKLACMALINIDEFDRMGERQTARLKMLMQEAKVNTCRKYQSFSREMPRMASFIATSNHHDLLTDPTGSRRFLCVDVEQKIDLGGIDMDMVYAQMRYEVEQGGQYWLTRDEEDELQAANRAFYQTQPVMEAFSTCFRKADEGEECVRVSLAEIMSEVAKAHPVMMRGMTPRLFGNALTCAGVRKVHTREGNRYLVRLKD